MCLLFLLLRHHLKIIRSAQTKLLPVAQLVDMRFTWDTLFSTLDSRVEVLVEVWRQQRLDIKSHIKTFAAGLFQSWYEMVCDTFALAGSISSRYT